MAIRQKREIAVVLIAGISAKEVVVSSCAVLFEVLNINSGAGMDTLAGILGAAGFGQLNAFCLIVFCLLYIPCAISTDIIDNGIHSERELHYTKEFLFLNGYKYTQNQISSSEPANFSGMDENLIQQVFMLYFCGNTEGKTMSLLLTRFVLLINIILSNIK